MDSTSRPQLDAHAPLRLICLPYAGGGSAIYRRWVEFLPVGIELCAIELPGRGLRMREAPAREMRVLVESLGRVIDPLLDRSFVLFGHSMGGLLCFELARWLRRHSSPAPLHLFLSAAAPPDAQRPRRILHALPDGELIDEIRRMNGTPDLVLNDPALLSMVLPILRADFQVLERYTFVPDAPLDCSLTVFAGLRDQVVPPSCMAAWEHHTRRRCRVVPVPGDHFFLHQPVFQWLFVQELVSLRTDSPSGRCAGRDGPGPGVREESQ
jgi:medium-chain acyl-[acyl-carrier-protein] hydrolase